MLRYFSLIFLLLITSSCKQDKSNNVEQSFITISLGHNQPKNSPQGIAMLHWDSLINLETQGKVRLKIFPNQKLGTDQEMVQKVLRKELDISIPPLAKLSKIAPKVDLINTPFLFSTHLDYSRALNSKLGEYLNTEIEKANLQGLGFLGIGMKYITSNKQITENSFSKIRTMKSSIIYNHYKSLNLRPINIDFHFVNQALKNGDIDAQENPLSAIYHMGIHKNQKYIYNSNHAFLASSIVTYPGLQEKLGSKNWDILKKTLKNSIKFHQKITFEKQSYHLSKLKSSVEYHQDLGEFFLKKSYSYRDSILNKNLDFKQIILNTPNSSDLIIGLDLSLEGTTQNSGKSIQAGVEIALEELNQKSFTHNQKVRSIALNNSGFPNRGIKNLNDLLKQKGLISIMTGMHSPVALKQLDIIHKEKIPFLIPWAAATPIISNGFKPNWAFRLSVRDEYAGEFLTQNALYLGYKNISLLLEDTPWGRSNYKSMTKALQRHKKQVNSVEWFNWGTQNFQDVLNRFDKNKTDVILFVGNAPEGIALLKSTLKNNTKQPILSHWAITGGNFYKKTKDILKKSNLMFLQTFNLPTTPTQKQTDFINKLRKKLNLQSNQPIPAPVGAIHAYDLTHLFVKAVQASPNISPEEIQKSMKSIKRHQGLFKAYKNPFKTLQEALDIDDFTLCRYDSFGNIIKVKQ